MKVNRTTIALIVLTAVGVQYSVLQAQSRSVWDGVFADDQAKKGQAAYNDNCSSCHGDTLMGGESAPALAGGEFLSNWNGLTLGDLFERIRTTMPQNRPGKLSREVCSALTNFPSGKRRCRSRPKCSKKLR